VSRVKCFSSDLLELKERVLELLQEYSSVIEYDVELKDVVIVDSDTNKFESLNN